MLERLELGKFERMLFVTLFALLAAVFNLGNRLRAAPDNTAGKGGGYAISYDSPIGGNVFTAQEIQPLALVPVSEVPKVSEPAVQPTPAAATQKPTPVAQPSTTQKQNNLVNKLL